MDIKRTSCLTDLWSFKVWFLYIVGLMACALTMPAYADIETMNRVLRQSPVLEEIEICHGGGCAYVSTASIEPEEWEQMRDICQPIPVDAGSERDCIAVRLAAFERVIGAKTGTDQDRGGTFGNGEYLGQMDCNDEAINTTNYLKLMQQHDLLRFHEIADIARRGFFFNGWPHTTAVMREIASGQRYAVDAWFYDNGEPAVVIPFETWKEGWRPEDSLAR